MRHVSLILGMVLINLAGVTTARGEGACCLADTSCVPTVDEAQCNGLSGVFLPDADCAARPCVNGACCFELSCNETDAYSCITAGREYAGGGITCLDDPCEAGIGACCLTGACLDLSPRKCEAMTGTWLGAGTDCRGGKCLLGACCLPGSCEVLAQFQCASLAGIFEPGGDCGPTSCQEENDCPSNALFGQSPDTPLAFTAYTSEVGPGFIRFEQFQGVAGSIEQVNWFGFDLAFDGGSFSECVEARNTFQVTLYEDLAGAPGAVVCQYTAEATVLPTGVDYLGAALNEYQLVLDSPCVVVNGWCSIVGMGDPDCWFLWLSSPDGDQRSLCENCQNPVEPDDLSFCLLGTFGGVLGACCDQSTGLCGEAVDIVDCVAPGMRFVPGTSCADLDPPCAVVSGACCFDSGVCFIDLAATCTAFGGEWLGAETSCDLCPPKGACCLGEFACTLETEFDCVSAGLTWLGQDTICEDCPPVPTCPEDSLFAQNPEGPELFEAGTSELSAGFIRFEDFSSVAGPIESLTWWGVDLDNIEGTNDFLECVESDNTFRITFHQDAGGVPGSEVCGYTLAVTRTPTGINYLGTELNEYTAVLPEPCVLVNGWVSIVGLGDPECWFLWMSSAIGDSYCQGCLPSPQSLDLAVCLQGMPGGATGACCDDQEALCVENVSIADCLGADLRFVPDVACADLQPPCGIILGACCADTGCIVLTAAQCAASGGSWLGANTLCDQCPCVTPCPDGAIDEPEPACGDDFVDTFNGGCVADTVAFTPITLGAVACGRGGVFLEGLKEVPDLDWYELTLIDGGNLVFTVEAEFRPRIWILDAASGCPGVILATGEAFECTSLSANARVGPGTYWLVVAPAAFTDSSMCGARYTARATIDGGCTADVNGDLVVDVQDLVSVITAWGTPRPDINGDGLVEVGDLLEVILQWGPCLASAAPAPGHSEFDSGARFDAGGRPISWRPSSSPGAWRQ